MCSKADRSMERKWPAGKAKDLWYFGRWSGGGAARADRHYHHGAISIVRRSSVVMLCLSLVIISLSGVASLRLLSSSTTTNHRETERELEEEKSDSTVPYRLGPLIKDWDEQRSAWLERNPGMKANAFGKPRLFMVTGSANEECANRAGDFWLLKAYKNKMDYCRLHDIDSYYNMAVMDPAMKDFWTKLPLMRKMMLTHPEAEWVWWVDSDAIITDMTFEIPLEKYKGFNMVIHGWETQVFEKKNWVGLNAGIYLLRNCQWTLDFLDLWASLGEDVGEHRTKMGKILTDFLDGRIPNFPADDQSSLIYLLHKMKDAVYPKVYLESSYYLHGFWLLLTDKFEDNMAKGQTGFGDDRWPFITHFVGCKLCGHNNDYSTAKCLKGMNRAFNLADNQVLSEFGFQHLSLESPVLRRVKHFNDTAHMTARVA